jgi:hypothetical protein
MIYDTTRVDFYCRFLPAKTRCRIQLEPAKTGCRIQLEPAKTGANARQQNATEYRNALHYYLYEMKSKLSCFLYARIQNVIGRLTTTLVSLGWRNSESLSIHPRLHFHTAPPIPSVYTNCFGT